MAWIGLTTTRGKTYVNIDNISFVSVYDEKRTGISFVGEKKHYILTEESVEEVMDKIRLAKSISNLQKG